MTDIKKKKINKSIIVILLIIIALAYPGYKLIYHLWYKNSSLDIIYYGCDNNYKTGKIEDSKYLFIMKADVSNYNKKDNNFILPDFIVNEKGEILNLANETKDKNEFVEYITTEGKYIFMYFSNSDVKYFSSDGKIIDEYNITNNELSPELMTEDDYLIGIRNGKCLYFNNFYKKDNIINCPTLSLLNSDNKRQIIKEFSGNGSAFQSIDNDNIYIVAGKDYNQISFYKMTDNTLINTYYTYLPAIRLSLLDRLLSPMNNSDYYLPLYNFSKDHYIVVTTSNGLGYINYEGKLVIDYNYKKAEPFFLGCAKVEDKKGNSYFIDINENKVSAPADTEKYTVIRKTSDNTFFAKSKSSDDRYLMDIDGNILRTFTSEERMYEFSDGYSFVYDYNEMNGYIINEKGVTTVDMWKDVYSKFSNIKKISGQQKANGAGYKAYSEYLMPYSGLSDSGLFFDTVLDDKGRKIQVVFNNKGQIQFACQAYNISGVMHK